jgi:peptide subunit release factor 1 (eRF1)
MSMTNVDHSVVRKLARWDPDGIPITTVYLTVDGRRYPRKSEYEVRLDELLRRARAQAEAEGLSKEALRPACGSKMDPVPDVVEEAVAQALRQGCRVETVLHPEGLARYGGIGALLRF